MGRKKRKRKNKKDKRELSLVPTKNTTVNKSKNKSTGKSTYTYGRSHKHIQTPVEIGGYTVYAAGALDVSQLAWYDYVPKNLRGIPR